MSARPLVGLVAIATVGVALSAFMRPAPRRVVCRKPRNLGSLKRAIIGNTRGAIASILGPPRASTSAGPHALPRDYWHATTWYYALPAKIAVAIEFEGDYAQRVEFIEGR